MILLYIIRPRCRAPYNGCPAFFRPFPYRCRGDLNERGLKQAGFLNHISVSDSGSVLSCILASLSSRMAARIVHEGKISRKFFHCSMENRNPPKDKIKLVIRIQAVNRLHSLIGIGMFMCRGLMKDSILNTGYPLMARRTISTRQSKPFLLIRSTYGADSRLAGTRSRQG